MFGWALFSRALFGGPLFSSTLFGWPLFGWPLLGGLTMDQTENPALAEAVFCEAVLLKSAETVLTRTLAGASDLQHWQHFPHGDAYDPSSGALWFYHCHPNPAPLETADHEHGHFHLFLRPEGPKGPIHHLIGIGVDAQGQLRRLFTVNHWVVTDDFLPAAETIALLPRFDAHLAKPCYLVNRWLTAVVRLFEPQIINLIMARDAALAAYGPDLRTTLADRALETPSQIAVRLDDLARPRPNSA